MYIHASFECPGSINDDATFVPLQHFSKFGLYDLEKFVNSKTWVSCHPYLLDERIIKIDDPAISSGVIALFVFTVLAPWWSSQEIRSDRNLVCDVR
jgi:hypothetical protein